MGLKDKFSSNRRQIYLSTGFIGFFIISFLLYGFYTGKQLITKYTPLVDAAMEIKLEVTIAHLWFEEILIGDNNENIETVWQHINQAEWYSQAMLEGGENAEGNFIPIANAELRWHINHVQQKLAEFKKITQQRFYVRDSAVAGTSIDQEYDTFFKNFIKELDDVKTGIQQLIAKDLKQFQITGIIIITTTFLITLFVGFTLLKYTKMTQIAVQKMHNTNKSLKKEIVERKQAESTIRRNEKLNSIITETAIDAIITINSKGNILSWNNGAKNIFGYSSSEMINKKLTKIIPKYLRTKHSKGIERLKSGGKEKLIGNSVEIVGSHKNGTEFPIELSLSNWKVDGQYNYTGIIRDVSERKNSELQQSVVYQISEAVHHTKDLDTLYKSIHKILSQVLDVTNFYIAQYDDETKMLSFPFDIDSEDEFPTTARPLGNGITEYMIKTGKPLLLNKNDIEDCKNHGKFEAVGALSEQWMGSPLKIKNKVIGVIAVNSYDDPNLYSKSDLKILTFVAEQVAIAIEQKQSITELEVEKTYLNELFTSSPEALALVTIDGTVLHINEQFTTLFGFKEKDVFGRNIDKLLVASKDVKNANEYTKKVVSGKRVYFEALRNKQDGTAVNVSVLSSPVNYKGDVLAVYAAYRDITDRIKATEIIKKSEEKYRSQSVELSESNSMKEMLLDVIAHDLRNPAGVIKGFAEFGLEMDPNNEILKEIDGGVNNLLNVISDATTLSKVALGDKITKEELDLLSIIKIAIDENTSQLEFADMQLDLEIRKKLNVMANPIICEVFRNYISNAIKYAKSGKKLIVDAVVDDKYVTVNVTDFGDTIEQEDRKNIFMRNVQLGKTKGRGLGLAIVKRIAEAHDAEVGVKPNAPEGNIFYLKLPLTIPKK